MEWISATTSPPRVGYYWVFTDSPSEDCSPVEMAWWHPSNSPWFQICNRDGDEVKPSHWMEIEEPQPPVTAEADAPKTSGGIDFARDWMFGGILP